MKLGTVYYVDLDRVAPIRWRRVETGQQGEHESIFVDAAMVGLTEFWMPIEMLAIPDLTRGVTA